MARSVTNNDTVTLADGVADLEITFSMPGRGQCPADKAADHAAAQSEGRPPVLTEDDGHVRMPLRWSNGQVGTAAWLRVADSSLNAADKAHLRRILKLLRDDMAAASGATGTPDEI
jgi:hypothetical protein